MNNAFTNLAACGTLFMNNNAALTTWGNAFQNLRMVNGNLQFTNHNVSFFFSFFLLSANAKHIGFVSIIATVHTHFISAHN
jgi:hypothetical protein